MSGLGWITDSCNSKFLEFSTTGLTFFSKTSAKENK
jgi:hypothetical protein